MKWLKKKKEKETGTNASESLIPEKALFVSDYLSANGIRFFKKGISKQQILTDLIKLLPYSKKQIALDAILEREKAGSTVIGPGIAAPHARFVDIPDIIAAAGICPEGFEESPGGEKIRLFLLFLGPANYMKRNLDFLASVSALLQIEGIIDSLVQCTTPENIIAKIREAEKR